MRKITGNKLLVKALREEGVDVLFGYPGACTIDISDELYKQDYTKVILPRHEQALVHAADAYARATGKVGVCLVTSGPGATNLVTGIATANMDSVPLVCFTGQVARNLIGNDAFQEVDIIGITRTICKYGVTVRNREDLGRIIKEAFYIARTGRPGPVVIDLPKDVMGELGSPEYPETVNIRGYKPSTGVHIGQLKRAIKMLHKAKRPLFLAGGEHMPPIWQSDIVTYYFRSVRVLMTVSPGKSMNLRQMHRLFTLTLIQHPFQEIFRWIFRLLQMPRKRLKECWSM